MLMLSSVFSNMWHMFTIVASKVSTDSVICDVSEGFLFVFVFLIFFLVISSVFLLLLCLVIFGWMPDIVTFM